MGCGWICDSAANNNIMNSFLLAGALRIGYCHPSEANALEWIDQVSLEEPPPPYPTFTCRTWTLHCIRGLAQCGFVKCHDVDELEEEAKRWGISHHQTAQEALQPRPVEGSRTCIVL
ncbi:hypothetical protein CC2G_015041 [Coprinopsis cinerea AmutBmut pab1-1]|nr:hypothetical protein CC2G_015041 [Coprinopsis cinerea AmutBmut pab1-1]